MHSRVMGEERLHDLIGEGRAGEDGAGLMEGGSGDAVEVMMGNGAGAGGAIRERPVKVIPCPRCQSMNTKFCYYNNYSMTQPRHFLPQLPTILDRGGTLRNVPVGGGSRKKARTRSRNDPYHMTPSFDAAPASAQSTRTAEESLLNASSCMQQLTMLPPGLNANVCMQQLAMLPPPMRFVPGVGGFGAGAPSQLPFLEGLYNPPKPAVGLQEVPELPSSFYDAPQVSQIPPTVAPPPLVMNGMSMFTPEAFTAQNEPLVSVMAKAGLWSAPLQSSLPEASKPSALQQMGGYDGLNVGKSQVLGENLKPGFWEAALMHSRPLMNDRLVPHASWEDSNPSTAHTTPNLSPNGSSSTDSMAYASSFSHHGFYEDVTQPWAGLHAADILNF